jgi:RNA polymerase sigma factor (sigma-70 family)
MESETDESLVTYMGFLDEEPETAEAAAGELFRRHSRKMTAWCIKSFLLYRQNHEELVQFTFAKAMKGAKAFIPRLAQHSDAAEKTKHIKCWLYRILRRTCIDAHRSEFLERTERADIDVDKVEVILDPPDAEATEAPPSRRVELVRQFAAELEEPDRAILYNAQQYCDAATGETVMPESVLEELCAELGLNQISLRTRRHRLLKRLERYIVDNE